MDDKTRKHKMVVVKMIAKDMENDAKSFEGTAFSGKNVAVYLGGMGAAVAALADIVKLILEHMEAERDGKE